MAVGQSLECRREMRCIQKLYWFADDTSELVEMTSDEVLRLAVSRSKQLVVMTRMQSAVIGIVVTILREMLVMGSFTFSRSIQR